MNIIDLHQDLMYHIRDRAFFNNTWQTSFDQIIANKVKVVVATAFPIVSDDSEYHLPIAANRTEEDFAAYIEQTKVDDRFFIIKTSEDISTAVETEGRAGIVMHIEGLNAFHGRSQDWEMLERYYDMGWRSCGIVWNITNALGGGTRDATQGLKPLGQDVLEWLASKNMIIDFAHMNPAMFWDTAKIVKQPIYVSHGNCHTHCETPRNYDDKQLKAIADSGGIIGPFFSKKFVTNDPIAKISHIADHFDHLKKTIGIDHIALGTDFGGITSGTIEKLTTIDEMNTLWDELTCRGYTTDMLEKIAYKNAQRLLTSILR